MSVARSDLASKPITLVKIEDFNFRSLESLWPKRYVGVIHLTREEVFVYDCTLEFNKHWKDPSPNPNRSQILKALFEHKDLNIRLSPKEWTVFYTDSYYDRDKGYTVYEDRYYHNCPSSASYKVSWWLAKFMEKIRYNDLKLKFEPPKYDNNDLKLKFESPKYDLCRDLDYLPTNQRLYQRCRFFTEKVLTESFPQDISTIIYEYSAHAMNVDPTAYLKKDKLFISRLSQVAEPTEKKLDTNSESTMSGVASKYLLSGMLANCIEKGCVTVQELDDIERNKPWIWSDASPR